MTSFANRRLESPEAFRYVLSYRRESLCKPTKLTCDGEDSLVLWCFLFSQSLVAAASGGTQTCC